MVFPARSVMWTDVLFGEELMCAIAALSCLVFSFFLGVVSEEGLVISDFPEAPSALLVMSEGFTFGSSVDLSFLSSAFSGASVSSFFVSVSFVSFSCSVFSFGVSVFFLGMLWFSCSHQGVDTSGHVFHSKSKETFLPPVWDILVVCTFS